MSRKERLAIRARDHQFEWFARDFEKRLFKALTLYAGPEREERAGKVYASWDSAVAALLAQP